MHIGVNLPFRNEQECAKDGEGAAKLQGERAKDGEGAANLQGECAKDGEGAANLQGECAHDGEGVAKLQGDMLQGMIMAGIACAQHGISIIEVQPSCLAGARSPFPSPSAAQAPFGSGEAYGCLAPSPRSPSAHTSCDPQGSASRNDSCEIWGPGRSSTSSAGTLDHLTRASSGSHRSSCDAIRGGGGGGGACAAVGVSAPSSGSLFGCGSLMARVCGGGWQGGEGVGAGAAGMQAADARFGRSLSGALAAKGGGGKGGAGDEPQLPYLGRIVYANPAFEAQAGLRVVYNKAFGALALRLCPLHLTSPKFGSCKE
ncbi:hypothetical protein DUNSADRAFT_11958 [Dunaliella salina]|uniref:Uncharacterized protein n=1 Tax=Dunaliella salina TaxID=3046 RepID=A0ABQ7GC85_DUNSA|nr:hypothetical protein DUNSADRAFT_11958 [Dunaliella salina]|eukprot:KAF5832229.1 hypothetical protein DUNSADRAFT_11958 [Dunaliella salina]